MKKILATGLFTLLSATYPAYSMNIYGCAEKINDLKVRGNNAYNPKIVALNCLDSISFRQAASGKGPEVFKACMEDKAYDAYDDATRADEILTAINNELRGACDLD